MDTLFVGKFIGQRQADLLPEVIQIELEIPLIPEKASQELLIDIHGLPPRIPIV